VRLRIVACEIFFRELCHLAARSPTKVDLGLLRRLVDGPWDEGDFLVLPPGRRVAATLGDDVIAEEVRA
jgi:hypothetical protein